MVLVFLLEAYPRKGSLASPARSLNKSSFPLMVTRLVFPCRASLTLPIAPSFNASPAPGVSAVFGVAVGAPASGAARAGASSVASVEPASRLGTRTWMFRRASAARSTCSSVASSVVSLVPQGRAPSGPPS